MATLSTMKTRIATELDRSDLTGSIANAIADAIAEYEQDRFWFNESRDLTFTTVAAQRIYTSSDASWIADVIEIDDLFVTVSGNNRCLDRISPEESELLSDSYASQGAPYAWAYFNKNIYLYPYPDATYTVRALAHYRLSAVSDGTSNAWTTEAERLIRRRAKQLIYAEMMSDPQQALAQQPLIEQEYNRLKAESSRRRATGIIHGSGW